MANTKKTPAPKTVESNGFTFMQGVELPAPASGGGGRTTEKTKQIIACPEDAAFMIDVALPADSKITDPAERQKALKELVRKESNSVTGRIRRLVNKDEYSNRNYQTRTVIEHDKFGTGVVVKRDKNTPAA